MPLIILEDKKGFKFDYGWRNRLERDIRIPHLKEIMPHWEQIKPGDCTLEYSLFEPEKEIEPGVWLYKERY